MLLVIIICGFVIWKLQPSNIVVTVPSDHTWSEYKNAGLGFLVSYPSDILHPSQIVETPSTDGTFAGAKTVVFFDAREQQRYFSVWIQQTSAKNTNEWFTDVYGMDGKGWHIATTTTIADVEAVGVSENVPSIAHDNYNLNAVEDGNAWSLSFDETRLSSADIEYMRQSFRFLK